MQPFTSLNEPAVGDWLASFRAAWKERSELGGGKRVPLRDMMFLFGVLFSLYGLIITRPVGIL